MSREFYMSNPYLSDYFQSLPPHIQSALTDSEVEIATLGELKQCAEHMMESK